MTHQTLIADDDPHICQTLARSLSLEGFAAKSVFLTRKLALQEIEPTNQRYRYWTKHALSRWDKGHNSRESGLGLSLVKQRTEIHGGHANISNVSGVELKFKLFSQ